MRYGIGFKLGLLLAAFGVVAMGLVGYYLYGSSRATLLDASQRDLLAATQVLGRNFQTSIEEVSGDALLLAQLPTTLGIARAHKNGTSNDGGKLLCDTFEAMMAVNPQYLQIRLISTVDHGLELVRLDRDGHQMVPVTGVNLQEKAHFSYVFNTLPLRRGHVYLSDISINHEEGVHSGLHKPTVRVATPVVTDDGTVQGVIVINLDLNGLFDRLKSDLPNAYQLYLSNHWGDYLIHPQAEQEFGFDQGRRVFIQEFFKPVAALINGQSASVVTRTESVETPSDALVAAFVRLPLGAAENKNFVILGLSQPLENVVRETRKLGLNTIQLILALSVLAILLAAVVSRVVTGPLRAMVKAMGQFSKEHVAIALPVHSHDEIGLLARTLNDMQTTLVTTMRDLNESREALKHLAQHDGLTGLPNRALFNDRLQQALSQARRDQTRLALLFVDLDEFKAINDTYGHHVGDALLIAVAQRMSACVRHVDTVGRLGGDEFVVLLTYVDDASNALRVADKICSALNLPFDLDGLQVHISSSIGVAIYPEHGSTELALSKNADAAMYQAKVSGKNSIRLFEA